MSLIAVDGLTIEELADFICDLLAARGYAVDRAATINLQMGDELIEWQFPAVVVARKADVTSVFVPRFGSSAAVPGYLAKYLDGARRNASDLQLYLACRDTTLNAYREVCALYGLGLVGCALDTHNMTFAVQPAAVDIATAFDNQMQTVVTFAEKRVSEWLTGIDAKERRFAADAKKRGRSDRRAEFDLARSRAQTWIDEVRERAAELRVTKSMEELRELRRLVEEDEI